MQITRGYKTEIAPTKAQCELLQLHIDGSRYIYNWALETRIRAHKCSPRAK
jgi:hypothetical protein